MQRFCFILGYTCQIKATFIQVYILSSDHLSKQPSKISFLFLNEALRFSDLTKYQVMLKTMQKKRTRMKHSNTRISIAMTMVLNIRNGLRVSKHL